MGEFDRVERRPAPTNEKIGMNVAMTEVLTPVAHARGAM